MLATRESRWLFEFEIMLLSGLLYCLVGSFAIGSVCKVYRELLLVLLAKFGCEKVLPPLLFKETRFSWL